ncbi:MAG: hypothetical protein ABI791_05690 [Acidobacteriota bacterium]
MDDKYNVGKPAKPQNRLEELQLEIEQLVKKRDAEKDPAAKQKLHAEVMRLFAQYERAKL